MSDDKPKPQIFAIMRNGHEVIRGGMTNVKEAIEKGNDMEAVKDAWNKLIRFEALHKTMEEGDGTDDSPTGFFKILDAKADGIVTQQGLYNLHGNLESLETSVSTAIESGDMDALQADYPKFMEENEAHLKQEEDNAVHQENDDGPGTVEEIHVRGNSPHRDGVGGGLGILC
eukprot:CAMPEP_0168836962 /NCGR_PEP_ID=MMETSP0727-20121128/4882_1 /TAXON_ID=265536 /ORGANISM="Amphiprora sp., Strain CCMP467" /LENGTH=171 /DNA_ID=CAMNT_0008890371 /DNA_START=42 /DNA_END=554 /DNA_ORIENTATION=-